MERIDLYEKMPYEMGGNPRPAALTPYLVDTDNDAAMLILPGGAYEFLAEHEGRGYAEYFNSLGINCFVLEYRIKPYMYPCPLLDARRAVRYIKANAEKFKINPEKIVVIGSSAGGHLAALTASFDCVDRVDEAEGVDEIDDFSPKLAGMILCYPAISFVTRFHPGCRDNLIGEVFDQHSGFMAENMSIELIAGRNMPPAFIWHNFDDHCVDVRNSIDLASRYKQLGIECELHIFPSGDHGRGLAEEFPVCRQWVGLCETWLKEHNFL